MHAVLLVGVAPEWLATASSSGYDTGERNTSEKIQASVQRLRQGLTAYQHTKFEPLFLSPDKPADLESFMKLLQSQKWDAISLGGGVRTIPQLGDYFTNLVNQIIRAQPDVKLLFPLLPEDVLPALKKYLPDAE